MGQVLSKVVALFLTIGLACSILFVKKKHTALVCKDIEIAIQDDPEQSFITPKRIVDLLQSTHKIVLDKTPLEAINTYTIQQELKEHPLIKEVLVYKTWHGVLKIWLQSKYFIARIIRLSPKRAYTGEFVGGTERWNRNVLAVREDLSTGSTSKLPAEERSRRKSIGLVEQNDAKLYVDGEGVLIEIKELPLLRLLIVTGEQINISKRKIEDQGLVALLHYIYKDAFWRKQITSLEVQEDGKIILGTQVGGHQIKFGYPDQIEDKFKKLALFYKHVIPYKGWNAYRMVNLAFKNQLICE